MPVVTAVMMVMMAVMMVNDVGSDDGHVDE